ncbi:hypothetical protein ACE02P_17890 [Shewanella bicestrii]
MANENLENRVIKGLWSLSGLKSSDFIALVMTSYPEFTGSRIRGLLSSTSNKNFRAATLNDLERILSVIWFWCQPNSLLQLGKVDLSLLLDHLDQSLAEFRGQDQVQVVLDQRRKLLLEAIKKSFF